MAGPCVWTRQVTLTQGTPENESFEPGRIMFPFQLRLLHIRRPSTRVRRMQERSTVPMMRGARGWGAKTVHSYTSLRANQSPRFQLYILTWLESWLRSPND